MQFDMERELDSTVQPMMCAVGRIHNGLRVVLYFRHATPSHYRHHAKLFTSVGHIR